MDENPLYNRLCDRPRQSIWLRQHGCCIAHLGYDGGYGEWELQVARDVCSLGSGRNITDTDPDTT